MVEQLPRTGKAGVCRLSNYHGRPEAYFARWTSFSGRPLAADVLAVISSHVETVVLLSKGAKGPVDLCSARTEVERRLVDSRKVKVDFSLEDMDLSEFKGKATYAQVKEYILSESGLKVSSLYIAQVKKKCGIETGENHYLPKSEKAKQPHVTPEKEEAIMKAFKHFGVI